MATVTSSSCPKPKAAKPARYCLCALTTHPGSFRCRLHHPTAANAVAVPSSKPEATKESAERKEAAAARALLARVTRTHGQDARRIRGFQPGPSRTGEQSAWRMQSSSPSPSHDQVM